MAIEILAPTQFPLDSDDPLAAAHRSINDYLLRIPTEGLVGVATQNTDWAKIRSLQQEAAKEILEMPLSLQFDCIRATARFSPWSRFEWGWSMQKQEATHMQMAYEHALNFLSGSILSVPRDWSEQEIQEIIEIPTSYAFYGGGLVAQIVENYLLNHPLTDSFREIVEAIRTPYASASNLARWLSLGKTLGEQLVFHRGEKWADDAITFIEGEPEHIQNQWCNLLLHCVHSEKAKPNSKWLKVADASINEIGVEVFEKCFCAWSLVYGQSNPSYVINQEVFKGLVWSASLLPSQKIAGALGFIALTPFTPDVSGNKAFSTHLLNACIWSLGEMKSETAHEQLLTLKNKVKGSQLKSVEKALDTIAARS